MVYVNYMTTTLKVKCSLFIIKTHTSLLKNVKNAKSSCAGSNVNLKSIHTEYKHILKNNKSVK